MSPARWFASVLSRFSWTTRTAGRGRRRVTLRKWVSWPNVARNLAVLQLEDRTAPAVFTVTTTNDSGAGSLRQAILDANAAAGADSIAFSIGTGAKAIAPTSALPAITQAVTLDATTQPGFSGVPLIELRGDGAGAGVSGLTVSGAGTTVRGFVINRFNLSGVLITGAGATGNVVAGNFIGTNAAGTAALANGQHGVLIDAGASLNRVGTDADGTNDAAERNVLSGNTRAGVDLWASSQNVVAGNYLGLNAAGTAAVGNGWEGVRVELGGFNNRIGSNADGSNDAAERNLIAGNALGGVRIFSAGSTGNTVAGNWIGLDATGTTALGNTGSGVVIDAAASNTVGGTVAAARNVIAGGTTAGATLTGAGATGNVVAGNFIGTNAAGTAALANADGVVIQAGATANTVGGASAASANVISGNTGYGVQSTSASPSSNTLQNNLIGRNAADTLALANGTGGVRSNGSGTLLLGGTIAQTVRVDAGTVSTAADTTAAGLTLTAGTVSPATGTTLTVTGTANFAGGTVTSAGTGMVVLAGASSLAASTTFSGNLTNTGTFTNAGMFNQTGGRLTISGGTFANQSGGTYTITGATANVPISQTGGQFTNAGTLVANLAGTNTVGPVANLTGGTIKVLQGTLALGPGAGFNATSQGTYDLASGTTLSLGGNPIFGPGASVVGAGYLSVVADLAVTADVSVTHLSLGGNSITVSSGKTLTLAFGSQWSGGSFVGGGTVKNASNMLVTGSGTRTLSTAFTNTGTGGLWLNGTATIDLGTTGLLTNQAGGDIRFYAADPLIVPAA